MRPVERAWARYGGATALIAAACGREPAATPSVTTESLARAVLPIDGGASRGPAAEPPALPALGDSYEDDLQRLARGVCRRKLACGYIGPGAPIATFDACLSVARSHAAARLRLEDCARGIDDAELDTCIAAIQRGACDEEVDVVGRVVGCSAEALCLY